MAYPRLLHLGMEIETKLRDYIHTQLTRHYGERAALLDELKIWQKDYWAKPTQKQKTFPFTGASNLIVPINAISVEAIHARTMTSLFAFGDKQFVAAEAISSDWADADKTVERYADDLILRKIRFRSKIESAILEWEKFGTGVAKSGYLQLKRKAIRTVGDKEEEVDVMVYDNATCDSVSVGKFLLPFSSQDPQTAPWVGEEMNKLANEVRQLEQSGLFYPDTYDKLQQFFNTSTALAGAGDGMVRELERNQEELENRQPVFPEWLDFIELWLTFDVDNDGVDEELVVHYHRPSQQFLSIRYNWHTDLHRPYRHAPYIKMEHRWAGIGIGKQVEQFMREITTIHRQRLDNATLANMRMLKINRLSGYGPREPIFPGKMWFVDDMTHIDSIQMGEVYQSSFENEQSSLIYSQQRTGVNEVTLGMPQVGTPGTATSDLTRVQEGSRKFDYCYANLKDGLINPLITDILCNQQQFGPQSITFYDYAEGGKRVQEFFTFPNQLIRDGVLLKIVSAGQQENKMLDRQNWQQIAQMFTQYAQGILALPIVESNPQISAMVQAKIAAGATEAARQMLDTFDIRNIDRILPFKEIEALVQNATGSVSQPAGTTGNQNASPTGSSNSPPPFLSPSNGGSQQATPAS